MKTHSLCILLLLSVLPSYSATITAVSCSSANVQAAITSSSTGDTVLVPGGSCSWSTTVTIPNTKAIVLSGQGTTTITGTGTLDLEANATLETRITGFTFTNPSSALVTNGSPSTSTFRIDHCTFNNPTTQSVFVLLQGNAPGLLDHNNFTGDAASEMIHNLGLGASDASGWTNDVLPGGPNMIFVEDNTFTYNATGNPAFFFGTSAMQSYYGARTVFRHNTLNMCQIDQHGTAGNIGARWWEIYDNTFNVIANGNQSDYIVLRAGSGVVWGNTTTGSTNLGAGSITLEEEDSGYPALYQIGRGINQNLSPAYVWANASTMHPGSGSSNVVLGRDFFVSSTQPTSLVRWELSTDNSGTTYAYVPYTYPHPLQSSPPPSCGGH